MERFGHLVENIVWLGNTIFAIRKPHEKPITRDPEFIILSMLMGEQIPISEIGRRLCRSKPGMSVLIERLVREGKVTRIPSEDDRRITRIAITNLGRETFHTKQQELRERVQTYFSPLTDGEIDRIAECLAELNEIFSRIRKN